MKWNEVNIPWAGLFSRNESCRPGIIIEVLHESKIRQYLLGGYLDTEYCDDDGIPPDAIVLRYLNLRDLIKEEEVT